MDILKIRLIFGVFAYLLPVIYIWRYYRIAYSEKGRWSHHKPMTEDMVFNLFPIINIFIFIFLIDESPYKEKKVKQKKPYKRGVSDYFYMVKKKETA
jgi:hypothetical protein